MQQEGASFLDALEEPFKTLMTFKPAPEPQVCPTTDGNAHVLGPRLACSGALASVRTLPDALTVVLWIIDRVPCVTRQPEFVVSCGCEQAPEAVMVERQSPPDMQQADAQPRIDLTASPTAASPWNRKRDAHGKLKKPGMGLGTAVVMSWCSSLPANACGQVRLHNMDSSPHERNAERGRC